MAPSGIEYLVPSLKMLPTSITRSTLKGCPQATEIGDRAEAIRSAVAALEPGDTLLIAGKGHETGQIVGDTVIPFDDREQAKQALEREGRHRTILRSPE